MGFTPKAKQNCFLVNAVPLEQAMPYVLDDFSLIWSFSICAGAIQQQSIESSNSLTYSSSHTCYKKNCKETNKKFDSYVSNPFISFAKH